MKTYSESIQTLNFAKLGFYPQRNAAASADEYARAFEWTLDESNTSDWNRVYVKGDYKIALHISTLNGSFMKLYITGPTGTSRWSNWADVVAVMVSPEVR